MMTFQTRRTLLALLLPLLFAFGGAAGCTQILVASETNTIEEKPGERTFARRIADESIEIKAVVNMHAADERFDDAHLVVVSYNGFVLIAGQVPQEELKGRATEVVRALREVRR